MNFDQQESALKGGEKGKRHVQRNEVKAVKLKHAGTVACIAEGLTCASALVIFNQVQEE